MQATHKIKALLDQLNTVVVGKPAQVRDSVACLLAGGHLLLEDVPGVGKTTLAHALAHSFGLQFSRVQFTADLMPSDLTGVSIYERASETFVFHPGPVFAQVLLADEINRASPKTQSALLEAMEERQITVAGTSHRLPDLFMVLATQNPIEQEGTYPLPEAELDRFMLKVRMDYPDALQELDMVREVTRSSKADMLEVQPLRTVLQAEDVVRMQQIASDLPLDEQVLDYAVRLARATRSWPGLAIGAGPRASIALVRGARARALLRGGEFVTPDDIKGCALAVLRHRVRIAPELDIDGLEVDQVLQQLLDQIAAPRQ